MPPKIPQIEVLIADAYAFFLSRAIDNAKQSIAILMFDWRWYENDPACAVQRINQAIVRAKKRGVDVRAIVDSSDSLKYFSELGLRVQKYYGTGLLHTKLFIIDNRLVLIGSHNMTNNALTYNQEASVAIEDEQTAQKFCAYFNNLWQSSNR